MRKSQIIAVLTVGVAACTASARNVIQEWSGEHPGDYLILSMFQPPYDDYGVLITGNSHPDKVWKFQAWNDVEDQPGYIDSISIADGPTVGGIHLSVIGQPPRPYGAAELSSLNLVTNGDETNTVDTIHISGNFGAHGPMQAFDVGTMAIGGSVLSMITVGDITGPLTIGAILGARLEAGNIMAPVTIEQLGADLGCLSMQDLTVDGPTPEGYPLPRIGIFGSYLSPYTMEISQAVNGLVVGGNVFSGEVHASAIGYLSAVSLSGFVQVDTDLGTLDVSQVESDGVVAVGGNVDLVTIPCFLAGTITTGGDVAEADIEYIDTTGLLDVGHDLGGGENSLYIPWALAGTVRVRNDLLASTHPEEWNLAAEIGEFQPPGTLQVFRDASTIQVGFEYGPEALPAGTSISVRLESDGVLREGLWILGDVASGSITVNDTAEDMRLSQNRDTC